MIRIALCFCLAVAVRSQCPPPSNCAGSGSAGGGSQTGCGGSATCKKPATTIKRTAMDDEPLFFTLYPNRPEYTNVDSVSLTLFPLPDNADTLTCYESTVYANGTKTIDTYTLFYNSSDNSITFANTARVYVIYILGYAGCGTYVVYRCGTYGDNPPPFVFGVGSATGGCTGNGGGKLGISCQLKAQNIVAAVGLTPPEGYYVLPFKLATECMTQQLCVPEGNPIYCQQGGKCQPYEESPAATCD